MFKIINKFIIFNYFKVVINTILIFFALAVILNLFEEIEFFKNLNQSFSIPILLSLSFVPTLILDLFPFIIFLSSMFYFLKLKSSKDLLSIKVFGYSNLKITFIVAFFAFMLGCFVLIAFNPVASTLVKFYESEKAKYSRDVDHLISVNKNGVWIKEINDQGYHIIKAKKIEGNFLKHISIFIFDTNNNMLKRIESKSAIISENPWQMNDVIVYDLKNNKKQKFKNYAFKSNKVLDKINSLYKNLNTISFLSLVKSYQRLNTIGYSKKLLDEQIHRYASLPFLLFLMVVLASIFTVGSVNVRQNYYYIILSIFISVVVFYFKDLSIALGQTEKIGLKLSVWMPVIAISLFCSIGVIQINEK